MKVKELLKGTFPVAAGNTAPAVPVAHQPKREAEVDLEFKLLDPTNPERPYTKDEIMKAMGELFKRIERQAAFYGGEVSQKTGKIDIKKHRYFDAQIAPNE